MKATWVGIYDRGNIANERVHFRASVDIDLRFCVILDTHYQQPSIFQPGGVIEAGSKNCYWFAPFIIKAGQNVVLYTRVGNQNTETRPDGSVFHFFFRGLTQPLFQQTNRCAVLFEINNWATTP
jgi:hypothetical protein